MHYKVANEAAAGATHISADDILKQLTLEEKVSICGASDWWRTVPIHRGDSLFLPHIKVFFPSRNAKMKFRLQKLR